MKRPFALAPTIALVALLGTACGGDPRDDQSVDDLDPTAGSTAAEDLSRRTTGDAGDQPTGQEERVVIRITIDDQTFAATLDDSAAARDLLDQLPVTLEMGDHGGVEKTGPLPGGLSLDGQPEGADPDAGDLGYYAPGNALVLYYGDQSYFPGIVILGRLDGDAAARIAEMDGSVTATAEVG